MKSFSKKLGVLTALLLTFTLHSLAEERASVPQIKNIDSKFILKGKEYIDPRTVEKIDTMGKELFVKTGIGVYIFVTDHYGAKSFSDTQSKMLFIKSFETNLTKRLKDPFVLLTLPFDDQHVNLLFSDRLKESIDKDRILDGYIIPLLASQDKNTQKSKISAALLNGYSVIVESVASKEGVKIDSVIHGKGRTVSYIWKIFMYLIVFAGLLVYFYALWKEKRR
jgi:hypothetical protein